MVHLKGFNDLKSQLQEKLSFTVRDATEIQAGQNNRLFHVVSKEGNDLFVKFYQKDNARRLQREFRAFSFLNSKGFTDVPKAHFKNLENNYAVYSFEKGISKKADEITKGDLDTILKFIVKLQEFIKNKIKTKFPLGKMACTTVQGNIDNINYRLKEHSRNKKSSQLHPEVARLLQGIDPQKAIHELLGETLANFETRLINYELKDDELRLSPIDFGPQNIIFRPNNTLCFVDFEYFGWDDPFKIVADFTNHDKNSQLASNKKEHFMKGYIKQKGLSKEAKKRLDLITKLNKIEWLTVYLGSVGPRIIKSRRFADTNFDEKAYISKQVKKFKIKLASAQKDLAC